MAAIAVTGLFALIAHEFAARRRELAIRGALGARPADLRGIVIREGVVLVSGGLLLGLPVAWLLGMGLSAAVHGVPLLDIAVLAATAAFLIAMGFAATAGPALRAARTRIADVLRAD